MGMTKYDRLLYILNLLRSRKTLNAARLAEECGVTERSIYRDIISLSEANVPIYFDNGYKLATDNFLPPLNFSFEEYACLKTALESTPLSLSPHHADLIRRVKAKVEAGLSEPTRERKRTAVDVSHVDIVSSQVSDRAAHFYADLEQAIADQVAIEIEYDTIEHGLSERTVEPYFIIFRGHAFYFVAYCRLREGFRTFRVDRLRALRVTEEFFARRADINARTYFDGSWQLFDGEPIEVVARFHGRSARVILTGKHHPDEEVERLGEDAVDYRVTVKGLFEISRWLLGFGDEVEVLQPTELRRRLAEVGQYFRNTYGK
ncbi:WYL domain-containing protein [candidate division GN15 bacterium]|nr:WYL domain-containing protein [candidate division GN15 bacterium]